MGGVIHVDSVRPRTRRPSLRDTVAVTLAVRDHPLTGPVEDFPDAGRWAAIGHVLLEFDDFYLAAHCSH